MARCLFEVACGHIACKGTSPLHELLFCVRQDSPLKLRYGHIAYKGTSPLHELFFCVGQDPPLKLPHGYFACKGTSPLHELLLCADLDHSLILPCDNILCILTPYFYVLHLDVFFNFFFVSICFPQMLQLLWEVGSLPF